jgi:hypothetical protein
MCPHDADDLDLPPLDGKLGVDGDEENEAPPVVGDEDIDTEDAKDHGDAFDDTTGEAEPIDLGATAALVAEVVDNASLLEADDVGATDIGTFDLSLADEGEGLEEDEPEVREPDEELGADEAADHTDGGEEGPLAEDEELREEDLPALDADDDGDVDDESLYDPASMGLDEELRWDDRAWARAEALVAAVEGGAAEGAEPSRGPASIDDADDSGVLAVPGEDARLGPRDATWRRLEESGRVTAAVLVPGESVVLALDGPERPRLVRILADGVARIIAEIDTSTTDDEIAACRVTSLRWDAARGCLVALGTFGAQAFRPA